MLETVPYFVGGGAEHSPEVMRVLGWAATSGAMGIVGVGDLQVRALSVAGTKVRVAPGVGIMPNRFPGATSQTYIGRNITETQIDVPATTSSGGKAWMVIMRVRDPQYAGAVPTDPKVGPYLFLELVACGATDKLLPAGTAYPYVPLARINLPASTATVRQDMVTDLREMANPRRMRDLNTLNLTAAETQTYTGTSGEQWPNAAAWTMEIPEWATQMRVRADWGQIKVPAGSATGYLNVQVGKNTDADKMSTHVTSYDTSGASQSYRSSFLNADTLWIPASMRGQTRYFNMRGQLTFASVPAARIIADNGSAVVLDVEYLESPTQDDF